MSGEPAKPEEYSVEFVPAAHVRLCRERIAQARERAGERVGVAPQHFDSGYWEAWFEANAEETLARFPDITLAPGYQVRYRCFGQAGNDLHVRPFVARSGTPVDHVRRLLQWHPPPDSMKVQERAAPTQDVELLYNRFSFPRTAEGYFQYWVVMQELWASARWAYSHVVASAEELTQLLQGQGWQLHREVERCEPAVVRHGNGASLAVLVHCPLQRFEVALHRIEIDPQQAIHYEDSILVASGPRGYIL
jgi:hypothetical protein